MRRIQPRLTPELFRHFKDLNRVAAAEPFFIATFRKLVEHTARLSFQNKDSLLFYRGQKSEHRNKSGNASYYPTIYRGDYLSGKELKRRFQYLDMAGQELARRFEDMKLEGRKEVKRRTAIRWSILQHYEVCDTPMLDFTHSLRVACSFATMNNTEDSAYVAVFGLPYLTNRITVNSEHDIVAIRLLSICPPTALRPYFQEGYLAGTCDTTTDYPHKNELDFNNRLIARFRIPNDASFWGDGFTPIPEASLYPDDDPIAELCNEMKQQ